MQTAALCYPKTDYNIFLFVFSGINNLSKLLHN